MNRMVRKGLFSLVVLLIAISAFGVGMKTNAFVHSPIAGDRLFIRRAAIESQGRQGQHKAIIFGDSIVEFAAVDTICGGRILNAGLAGARVEDVARLAPPIAKSVRADTAIVAVGANDAARQIATSASAFAHSYRYLVDSLRGLGMSVKVATLAPFGETAAGVAGPYDPVHATELNAQIRGIAAEMSLPVVDFAAMPRTASGALRMDETADGIHLTSAGYQEWLSILRRGICPE